MGRLAVDSLRMQRVLFFFLGHENVLKWFVAMVAQLCEYTKNY